MTRWMIDRSLLQYVRLLGMFFTFLSPPSKAIIIFFQFHSIVCTQTSLRQNFFFSSFVLRNISLFQLWKTKSVKSHFPSISPVESAITAPPSPASWTPGDAVCGNTCVYVCEKRVCINLLSFLILQSYREKWQAQMSRRGNYHSANKCGSVCVWVGWLGGGRRGLVVVGPFTACWWEALLLSSSPLPPCLSPSIHPSHTHTHPRTPVIRQLSGTQILT